MRRLRFIFSARRRRTRAHPVWHTPNEVIPAFVRAADADAELRREAVAAAAGGREDHEGTDRRRGVPLPPPPWEAP